jgi:murein DD-endopeptidase MepM/ murein hydrolase activator NlpD
LQQPLFLFPFQAGESWTYTGGPHSGWGTLEPYSGIDFAPPANTSGCIPTELWATALADGVVVRSETGIIVLDLDGDGEERTGWNIFYLHVATEGRRVVGTKVKAGEPIGHPSCEGGRSTGTHIHIARKYNGEWIPADGTLAFNLEGWVSHDGTRPYLGTLTRGSETVTACDCSNMASQVTAGN